MIRKTRQDYYIDIFCYSFMTILGLLTLFPFANILAKSFSDNAAVVAGKVGVIPVGFQLGTMKYVVTNQQFLHSFLISLFVTTVGSFLSIALTGLAAYPLSKKGLFGVKAVLILYVFTMLFNGGLIPNFMLIKKLGLYNNLLSIILPGAINVFNMLLIKNYYESLPESMEESAKLDGASDITVLIRIIVPLSMPVFATISVFTAVTYWNDYFNPMMYIDKPDLKPLQLYLRAIVLEATDELKGSKSQEELLNMSSETVRAATVIASTVPILCVYPFMQKYFIKGILIGSVKG